MVQGLKPIDTLYTKKLRLRWNPALFEIFEKAKKFALFCVISIWRSLRYALRYFFEKTITQQPCICDTWDHIYVTSRPGQAIFD